MAAISNYHLSNKEIFLSFATGFSAIPYAMRHFQEAKNSGNYAYYAHKAIGSIQCIPVIGGLCALAERIAVLACKKIFAKPIPPVEKYKDDETTPIQKIGKEDDPADVSMDPPPVIEIDQKILDNPKALVEIAATFGVLYYKDYESIRLHLAKLAEQNYPFEPVDKWICQAVLGDPLFNIEEFQKLPEEMRCKIFFVANRFQHEDLVNQLKPYTPKGENIALEGYSISPSDATLQETRTNIISFYKTLREEGSILTVSEFFAFEDEIKAKLDGFLESLWNHPPSNGEELNKQVKLFYDTVDAEIGSKNNNHVNFHLMRMKYALDQVTYSSDFKNIIKKVGKYFRNRSYIPSISTIKEDSGAGFYVKSKPLISRIKGIKWCDKVIKENNLQYIKVPKKILIVNDSLEKFNVDTSGELVDPHENPPYCLIAEQIYETDNTPSAGEDIQMKANEELKTFAKKSYFSDFYGRNFLWHFDHSLYCIDTEFNSFTFPPDQKLSTSIYRQFCPPNWRFTYTIPLRNNAFA